MITLDLRGLDSVQQAFSGLASGQIPYALSLSLNNTAFKLLPKSKQHLASTFDRPTPLIKGATRVQKATKESLEAVVYIDPKRAPILQTHELGGARGDQTIERFLKRKGWLPSGWRAIPSVSIPKDAYGNPKRSEINLIISELSSGISGVRYSSRRCFVIRVGVRSHLHPGVYRTKSRSVDRAIMPLYLFVSRAQYRAVLEWETVIKTEAGQLLPAEAEKAVRRAIETAR